MVEFLSIDFLTERKFKDSEDKEMARIYRFSIPYGTPYEEIRSVINELNDRIDQMELDGKKRELEAKEAEEITPEVVN